jgi:hypothetical protein
VILFGVRDLADIKVKILRQSHLELGCTLRLKANILIRDRKGDTETQRKVLCKNNSRDWSCGRGKEEFSTREPLEGVWSDDTVNSDFWPLDCDRISFYYFNHQVSDNVMQP